MTGTARLGVAVAAVAVAAWLVGLGWAIHYRAAVNQRQADLAAAQADLIAWQADLIAWQADYAHRNCASIEKLKSYTAGAIRRALKTLPRTAYYRDHPAELTLQLDELELLKRQFAPRACP